MLGSMNIAGSLWHARRNESRSCQPHFMWETLDNGVRVQHNTCYLSFSRVEGQEVVLLVNLFPFYTGILFYLMRGSNNSMCYSNDAFSPPPLPGRTPGICTCFSYLGVHSSTPDTQKETMPHPRSSSWTQISHLCTK